MDFKKEKKTTAGSRHQISIKKNKLSKAGALIKTLLRGKKKNSGRSTQTGNISSWHKGGGTKFCQRHLSFEFNINFYLTVSVFYDPNRNVFILLKFNLSTYRFVFVIHTVWVAMGTFLEDKDNADFLSPGFSLHLKHAPLGALVHSLVLNKKTKYSVSAGTFIQVLQRTNSICKIKLPSGIIKTVALLNSVVLGVASNNKNNLCVLGKAGKSRYKHRRPTVRGAAMNPVDHPHGGRTRGGRPPVTPWGKLTKGVHTCR